MPQFDLPLDELRAYTPELAMPGRSRRVLGVARWRRPRAPTSS